MNNALPNHRDKMFGGAWPVPDPEILEFVANDHPTSDHKAFVQDYYEWFAQPHNIQGLQKFLKSRILFSEKKCCNSSS